MKKSELRKLIREELQKLDMDYAKRFLNEETLKKGDKIKIIKGKYKGMEGILGDVYGKFAYGKFPGLASLGKNTEFSFKLSNVEKIK